MKGYPYFCPLCRQSTFLLMKPSIDIIFRCLLCDKALQVVDMVYTKPNRTGAVGLLLRYVPDEEIQQLYKDKKIEIGDLKREDI